MRLPDKSNIQYLNHENTVRVWEECKTLALKIHEGEPLVENDFVLKYSYLHLLKYGYLIVSKLTRENYLFSDGEVEDFSDNVLSSVDKYAPVTEAVSIENLFC